MGDIPETREWTDLVGRVRCSMDEQELSALVKREAAMKAKYERLWKTTHRRKPPFDLAKVRDALVRYERSCVFSRAVKAAGCSEADVVEARKWDADVALVYDFILDRATEVMRLRARDIAVEAQEGLETAVTTEGCKLNVKALELALERGASEVYGDPGKKGAGGRTTKGAGVVYSLPNLTVNMITAPGDLAKTPAKVVETVDAEVITKLIGDK